MALETATYISDLVSANPTSTDPKSQGDDHLRLVKATVKATFPNINAPVTPTPTELNYVGGVTSSIQGQINAEAATRLANDNAEIAIRLAADLLLAPLAGAVFTGAITVLAPTAAFNPATKAYVDATATVGGMVPIWVSGNTYTAGNMVYSPLNFQTYRHSTATSSLTTDPSLDTTNWVALGSSGVSSTSYFTGQF